MDVFALCSVSGDELLNFADDLGVEWRTFDMKSEMDGRFVNGFFLGNDQNIISTYLTELDVGLTLNAHLATSISRFS